MSYRRQQITAMIACATLLLAGATLFVWIGSKAIRERHWSTTSTTTRTATLGPFGKSDTTVKEQSWEGSSAQVLGSGFVSLGLMFGVWALGCLRVAIHPVLPDRPGPLSMLAAIFALLAVIGLLPPWTANRSLTVAVFWVALAIWFGAIAVINARHQPGKSDRASGRIVFALFVGSVVFEVCVPVPSDGGAVCAILVAFLGLAHALFLYPPWRRWGLAQDGLGAQAEQK